MWAGLRGNRRNVATAALIFFGIAVWGSRSVAIHFRKRIEWSPIIVTRPFDQRISAPLALAAAIATRQSTEARLLSVQDKLNRQIERKNLAAQQR